MLLRCIHALHLAEDMERSEEKDQINICLKTHCIFLINTMKAQQAQRILKKSKSW